VWDACGRAKAANGAQRTTWQRDAQQWIDADDWQSATSFCTCCAVLDLDLTSVRRALRTASERLPKRRHVEPAGRLEVA
jgi:hypothetical protein